MDPSGCCEFLSWDSTHFGLRIARVNPSRLTPALVHEIANWEKTEAIDCCYFLCDPDPVSMALAAEYSYRFVDVRAALSVNISQRPARESDGTVRLATSSDIPALREIAARGHRESRFYVDGRFLSSKCDELYRVWIQRSCLDRSFADAVFVASRDGRPAGYITCQVISGGGQIGLFAVSEESRSLGFGRKLVDQALAWFREQRINGVNVVTQGSNIAALRVYQKAGFLPVSTQFWYHWWSRK